MIHDKDVKVQNIKNMIDNNSKNMKMNMNIDLDAKDFNEEYLHNLMNY